MAIRYDNKILALLVKKNDIKTVPQLAAALDIKDTIPLMEALYRMRKDGYISWRPGKFLYIRDKGYKLLQNV